MTVLCLVELDDAGAADVSLRALTFARVAGRVRAASWRPPCSARRAPWPAGPGRRLAAYGVSDAYVVEPGRARRVRAAGLGAGRWPGWSAERRAPPWWRRAPTGAARCWPTSARSPACRWPRTASRPPSGPARGAVTCVVRHRWAGSLLEDACSRPRRRWPPWPPTPWPPPRRTPRPTTTVHAHEPALADGDLRVRAAESAGRSAGVSLATARVVVGGGRGVGGPDGFAPLEELAGLLGGVVGVSRVVTSEGWRPHKQQVGQTGTRISPELYLACGISGAIQHMAGCASAKHIVAVNTDPDAPIIATPTTR